jgi:hypothetical protein
LSARFILIDERNQSTVALTGNGGSSSKIVSDIGGDHSRIRKNRERIDLKGAITLSATITSFLVGLTLLQSDPISSTTESSTNLQIVCAYKANNTEAI